MTRTDPHAQRLARLQWELVTRKELNQEVEEREVERDKVELVIRTREDKLRDLGPQLSKILDTTLPVQKYLELPLTDTRDQLGTNIFKGCQIRAVISLSVEGLFLQSWPGCCPRLCT